MTYLQWGQAANTPGLSVQAWAGPIPPETRPACTTGGSTPIAEATSSGGGGGMAALAVGVGLLLKELL